LRAEGSAVGYLDYPLIGHKSPFDMWMAKK